MHGRKLTAISSSSLSRYFSISKLIYFTDKLFNGQQYNFRVEANATIKLEQQDEKLFTQLCTF